MLDLDSPRWLQLEAHFGAVPQRTPSPLATLVSVSEDVTVASPFA